MNDTVELLSLGENYLYFGHFNIEVFSAIEAKNTKCMEQLYI